MKKIKYCQICRKDIAGTGEIHIAGTICLGHGFLEIIIFKIVKMLKGGE